MQLLQRMEKGREREERGVGLGCGGRTGPKWRCHEKHGIKRKKGGVILALKAMESMWAEIKVLILTTQEIQMETKHRFFGSR